MFRSFSGVAGFIAGQERQLILARARAAAVPAQQVDLGAKRLDILKAAIHGCEAHVADLIQMPQLLHDQLADGARGYLALAHPAQLVANPRHRRVDRLAADRALFQRLLHAGAQLALIERLAAAVALDHGRHHQFGRLEGCEAFRALEALASPPDLPSFVGQARIDDLGIRVSAKWTMHGAYLSRRGPSRAILRRAPGCRKQGTAGTAPRLRRARASAPTHRPCARARLRSSWPPAPLRPP